MVGNILTPTHLIIVLAVALLVLGPKRLPAAGRSLGEAIQGFKEAISPNQPTDRGPLHERGDTRRYTQDVAEQEAA